MRKNFQDQVTKMKTIDRISKARSCVEAMTHRVQNVIELHVANEIVQYSDQLSGQIPRSRAAKAFNTFQDAMYYHEVIRLLALWDHAADNAVSIPTVVALIDDHAVVEALQSETFEAHANRGFRNLNPSDDPEIQNAIDEVNSIHQREFAKEQSDRAEQTLRACIVRVGEIEARQQTTSIRNLRNHLAHSLTLTRREAKSDVPNAKYGDERELLLRTTRLIEDLYCWVNGTSYDISGEVTDHARKCAEELWMNCHFEFGKK